jgi:hypothetical protein
VVIKNRCRDKRNNETKRDVRWKEGNVERRGETKRG